MVDFFHKWARRTDWLVIDTETTGVTGQDQIVEVCAISAEGRVLVNTLVKPTCRIHPSARRIHDIDAAMVRDAPTFAEIAPALLKAMRGRHCLAYQASFDRRMLMQSWKAHRLVGSIEDGILPENRWKCVMQAFAKHHGQRVKLIEACKLAGSMAVDLQHFSQHHAYGDTALTHRLIHILGQTPMETDAYCVDSHGIEGGA